MLWLVQRLLPIKIPLKAASMPPDNAQLDDAADRAINRGHRVLGLVHQTNNHSAGRVAS